MPSSVSCCFFSSALAPPRSPRSPSPPPAKDPPLIVVDTAGKEGEIQNWKIVAGIKRYVLQVEAKGEKPDPAKAGQDFVEFREDNSTDLKDGILTLVPLSSVRKLEYDAESKGVTLTAAVAEGKTAKLTGTTRFVNINKFFVEGSLDLGGDLGKATLKYQGGMSAVNPGVREFRLPFNQPVTQPTGTVYLLSGVDEDKSIHKIYDPKVLYRAGGADRVSGTLWFKETAKIPLTKIHTMSQPEEASEWRAEADRRQTASAPGPGRQRLPGGWLGRPARRHPGQGGCRVQAVSHAHVHGNARRRGVVCSPFTFHALVMGEPSPVRGRSTRYPAPYGSARRCFTAKTGAKSP